MPSPRTPFASILLAVCLVLPAAAQVPAQVPAPSDVFGFEPGADFQVADYGQMLDYFRRLDAASDRVRLVEIGRSAQGRPLVMLVLSSADNLARLDRWRSASARLARARLDEDQARALAREAKAVVWIDGGLHATELAGSQMSPLLAYRVATEASPEMARIRDEVILLLMPVMNPDGLDLVAGWYRSQLGTPFETTAPPWLYHAVAGHDNNRDWFMHNLPETAAVSRVLYEEWFPQIVVDHHQSAPAGARIFIPPFADPVNPRIHPGVTAAVNLVGSAMASRFAVEGMPGVVSGQSYSMWWNGGMRTVPYFHNMVGILTEVAHASPTPRLYAREDLPATVGGRVPDGTQVLHADPWHGGLSRLSDAVDYMVTASVGVLDLAARLREHWLLNVYRMGRDAIARGTAEAPYAYVVPAGQRDPGEAHALVDALRRGGVEVHRALAPFAAGDTTYAAGSFVLYTAQAFRPYLMDLLEPQVYPDRRLYPGGPPEPPYDLTGWTLPLQMGVRVDRVAAPFDVLAVPVTAPVRPEGGVDGTAGYGYLLAPGPNAAAEAINRLVAAGEAVAWAGRPFTHGGRTYPAGTAVVAAAPATADRVAALARAHGLVFEGVDDAPPVPLYRLGRPRVGIYKSWVAGADEGWTRWLLESYAFAVDTLHDADVRGGDLSGYDVLILPDQRPEAILHGHAPGTMPAPYTGGLGDEGVAALRRYVEAGGTLVAFDSASDFAIERLGLPVRNAAAGVSTRRLYVPGSLLWLDVDTSHPFSYGTPDTAAAVFDRSAAFEVRDGAAGVEVAARYAATDVLASGWALGADEHLGGKAALVRAPLGRGSVVLFGFRPQFRGQSRGTYKLLFNVLHSATLDAWPGAETAAEE